jgi:stress-induced morphogen
MEDSPMSMDAVMLKTLIKAGLGDAEVHIEDLRGDGRSFSAHVVSGLFSGLTRLQQHQMVYKALEGYLEEDGYGLQLSTSEGRRDGQRSS